MSIALAIEITDFLYMLFFLYGLRQAKGITFTPSGRA